MTEFDLKKLFPAMSQSCLEANSSPVLVRKKDTATSTLKTDKKSKFGNSAQLHGISENLYDANPDPQLPDALTQRNQKRPLVPADAGEKEGFRRTTVSFTGYRVRPLDPDNFAGSVKDLLDGLRHAGVIQGDEPWKIILQTDQVKVNHFKDEKTVIQITYPDV